MPNHPDLETNRTENGPRRDREEAATPDRSPPPGPGSDTGVEEIGGPAGPDPTRFGDWERKGRCIDF